MYDQFVDFVRTYILAALTGIFFGRIITMIFEQIKWEGRWGKGITVLLQIITNAIGLYIGFFLLWKFDNYLYGVSLKEWFLGFKGAVFLAFFVEIQDDLISDAKEFLST